MNREHRRLATILVGTTGVLATHGLAYVIAHPASLDRREALDGHAYLSTLGMLAVPLAALALGWATVRATRSSGGLGALSVGRLAAWQTLGFLGQEIGERAVTGDAAHVVHEPAVAVGLLLQLPVAALLVALVRTGRRVRLGDTAGGSLTATRSAAVVIGPPAATVVGPLPVPLSPLTRRGPPLAPLTH